MFFRVSFFCLFAVQVPALLPPMISSNHPEAYGYDGNDFQATGEQLVLTNLLKAGDVVFDVGAHQGKWSLLVLGIEPKIHLYSFEPHPQIFNILSSSFSPSMKAFNLAFSNQRGRTYFYAFEEGVSEGSGFFWRRHLAQREYQRVLINIETLDHFCQFYQVHKIDYLKIDTEGAELSILQGAKNMLFGHQIVALQFEYGGAYVDAKATLKQALQLLTQAGYAIFRLSAQGIIPIAHWEETLENYRYSNYFAMVQSLIPEYPLIENLVSDQKSF